MSRHRFVKNLTEDDYYDDDYYDEEDYWEEEEQQGIDDIDDGRREGMVRKRRRRIQDEISLKISAMNLKVKGLLDPKKASSSVEGKVVHSTAVEDEEVASTFIDEKSGVVDCTISNPASTSFVPSSLQSVQPGTTLASLASLTLSSAAGSTATGNSKFSEMSLGSLSSKAVPVTKTLNLTDLLKKSSSTVSPSNGFPSAANSTAAAPSLSLSQILNSKPASLVPSSVPTQSSNKITLNDLLKSSSPSNIMSSIPHSIPAATLSSKPSKIDSRIVCEKPSSTLARFLAVPSSSSPIATITHSALLDAIDLTSISILDGNQVAYKFTDPSPDDIVSNARQKKPGSKSSKT